jgi:hypothetical protein
VPACPTGAIKQNEDGYWIDETLCNNCRGYHAEPQCVVSCPINSPVPKRAKKGRCKVDDRVATSPDLFPDGKTSPFASAIAVWELCNILAQRQTLAWEMDNTDKLFDQKQVNRGWGRLVFCSTDSLDPDPPTALKGEQAKAAIAALDIRAACIHLIFAAYATILDKPWEEEFIVSDRQLEDYLGLDKRKDLSKPARLTLLKELVQQPCKIQGSIYWHQQGKVHGFAIEKSRLWHLVDIQHHFQEDELGCKHLVGLTFTIRTGEWAKYFLNKQGCKANTAFYQYGILPKSLLNMVMSIWQQREGAVRMLSWLLFKTKMGKDQRITVPTLMRVAYGEGKVTQASLYREERKRLLRTFEGDLEMLHQYGLKPVFDPVTYPPEIQPLWAKLADLPDEAEEALEF